MRWPSKGPIGAPVKIILDDFATIQPTVSAATSFMGNPS